MLWAAGPLLLLGLVEAGYAAQERRYAELLKARKGNEEMGALLPEAASLVTKASWPPAFAA